jgi:hypothetical protein
MPKSSNKKVKKVQSKKAKNLFVDKNSINSLFIYMFLILILFLTIANLNVYFSPRKDKVLGAKVENMEGIFWYNFLQENPKYIPGWKEIGRTDKVKALDPNYF